MSALGEADLAYIRIVECARRAKIGEENIKKAGLIYYHDVRSLYRPALEDPEKVIAFAKAIDGISEKIAGALDATPDMKDLIALIEGFSAELTEAFSVSIDFDTALITAHE